MIPYFSNPTARAALFQAVRGWIGTPFHGHACVRGVGVDCVHLAAALYVETGLLAEMPDFGTYDLAGGSHSARNLIHAWLDDHPAFRLVWDARRETKPPAYQPGDLVNYRLGRQPWHVGVVLEPPRFVEVHNDAKVSDGANLENASFRAKLNAVWRPVLL